MTPGDLAYCAWLLERHYFGLRVLDVGGRNVNGSVRDLCLSSGRTWHNADILPGGDYQFDLTNPEATAAMSEQWDTVLLFNVLEHIYDPIRALENAMTLVSPNGTVAIITPTIWQLHDWPADHWRPLPDFYIEFAMRHQLYVPEEAFRWIYAGHHERVDTHYNERQRLMPSRLTGPKQFQVHYSRVVHRLLGTTGRAAFFPWLALGVVFQIPGHTADSRK